MADEETPTDSLGIASIVLGALTWVSCFVSCVPYIGVLAMFPSMMLSLVGTIIGVVGLKQARAAKLEPQLSIIGLVLSGIPLAIWVCYWLFLMLMMVLMFAGVAMVIILDAVN